SSFCELILLCAACLATRQLHSFPTRRSSDLIPDGAMGRSLGMGLAAAVGLAGFYAGCVGVIGDGGAGSGGPGDQPTLTPETEPRDRKSTRLNSSHVKISYAVFCLKKKIKNEK